VIMVLVMWLSIVVFLKARLNGETLLVFLPIKLGLCATPVAMSLMATWAIYLQTHLTFVSEIMRSQAVSDPRPPPLSAGSQGSIQTPHADDGPDGDTQPWPSPRDQAPASPTPVHTGAIGDERSSLGVAKSYTPTSSLDSKLVDSRTLRGSALLATSEPEPPWVSPFILSLHEFADSTTAAKIHGVASAVGFVLFVPICIVHWDEPWSPFLFVSCLAAFSLWNLFYLTCSHRCWRRPKGVSCSQLLCGKRASLFNNLGTFVHGLFLVVAFMLPLVSSPIIEQHQDCPAWLRIGQGGMGNPNAANFAGTHFPAGIDLLNNHCSTVFLTGYLQLSTSVAYPLAVLSVSLATALILDIQARVAASRRDQSTEATMLLRRAIAYVSHEARGPLNAAVLSLALLEESTGALTAHERRHLLADLSASMGASKRHLDDLLLWEQASSPAEDVIDLDTSDYSMAWCRPRISSALPQASSQHGPTGGLASSAMWGDPTLTWMPRLSAMFASTCSAEGILLNLGQRNKLRIPSKSQNMTLREQFEVFVDHDRVLGIVANALSNSIKHIPSARHASTISVEAFVSTDPADIHATQPPAAAPAGIQSMHRRRHSHLRKRAVTPSDGLTGEEHPGELRQALTPGEEHPGVSPAHNEELRQAATHGKANSDTQLDVIAEYSAPFRAVLVVKVQDNGEGIAEELLHSGKLFTPFTRLRQGDDSLKMASSGLGLAIIRSLAVDNLGGDVSLASRGGEGAIFLVRIPVWARERYGPLFSGLSMTKPSDTALHSDDSLPHPSKSDEDKDSPRLVQEGSAVLSSTSRNLRRDSQARGARRAAREARRETRARERTTKAPDNKSPAHHMPKDLLAGFKDAVVYVVDDERVNRTLLAAVLRRWGLSSETFSNGRDVLSKLLQVLDKVAPFSDVSTVTLPSVARSYSLPAHEQGQSAPPSDSLHRSGSDGGDRRVTPHSHSSRDILSEEISLPAHARPEPAAQWPVLVTLDIEMPVMDGRQFLKAIRRHVAELKEQKRSEAAALLEQLPIVVVSGNARKRDTQLVCKLGAKNVVSKPIDTTELSHAILQHAQSPISTTVVA
jgi:signal transduction histidine kinase/CheY-like chemotaxis protein